MIHARDDYNRIQDPEGKIGEDEPVFLIRAQDRNAPLVVEYWAEMAELLGADQDIINLARQHAARMRQWQIKHGDKIPDLSED